MGMWGQLISRAGSDILGTGQKFLSGGETNAKGLFGKFGDWYGELTGQNEEMKIAQQNLEYQQEKLEWDKATQERIFAREDNAIQRRVNDLKAAGLSPVLAAGQGASAGAVVSTKAPQQEITKRPNLIEAAQITSGLLKMKEDIATTIEQRKLLQAQQQKTSVDTALSAVTAATKQHDLDIYTKSGTASNSSSVGKLVRDLFGFADSPIMSAVKKQVIDKVAPKGKDIKVIQYGSRAEALEAQRKFNEAADRGRR